MMVSEGAKMKNENLISATEWNEEQLWQAVQQRDARFEGLLVYAVRSTGIYCKPTCPSRRPRRENVLFFHDVAQAEAAGFRACRRCHPQDAISQNEQVNVTRQACALMDASPDQPPSLDALSQELHLSASHLQRVFKSVLGITPRQYAANQKLATFKQHVRAGSDVTTALYDSGYSSTSRLYEGVTQRMGMTPASYRQGGAGKQIHFTIVQTYLGKMLVAGTDKGICAISFGQDEDGMVTLLRAEYPAAELLEDESHLMDAVHQLVKHLEGSQPHLSLPLDLQATAFQLRVWEELRRIPYGQTRTYAEVAQAIGRPKAVRAVANACAANPVVVATPCHRVVRSDGSLGGYRYGVERKRALLSKEQGHSMD
jgi:AraC family transcriptional regulator, regulatory protein of adaptative response / methylated-DNA-[protein]-cysteine methyltransferase